MAQYAAVRVAIIGSGFSGLAIAIELKRANIDDFVLLERESSLGGTWRDNRYPGCACDIPSHLYSYSFAPKSDWSRVYAAHDEIRAYLEDCADRFDVRRHVLFGHRTIEARWNEATAEAPASWRLRTADGETISAQFLVMAIGALSNPAYPRIEGLEAFRGARFHSARWDHDFDLRGKRVAVIGTGASAIQFVPQIQPQVQQLFLLQRTPPWVLPKPDRAIEPWEISALERWPGLRWLYRQQIYWSNEARFLAFMAQPLLMRWVARAGRGHIARSVSDPALRELLTPKYVPGCKRILMSNDYYPALAQPNVEVLADPPARAYANGLELASGRCLEVDALVYGTGFAVHDYLGGMSIVGRGGLDLGALWKQGARAHLGTMVAGFPNLFTMTGPNTGLGHNSMITMIEGQASYARKAIEMAIARQLESIEVKKDVQDAYNRRLETRQTNSVWSSGCKSWYLDASGRNTTLWPGFASTFRARTAFFSARVHRLSRL